MLQITNAQMQAFSADRLERTIARLKCRLQSTFPNELKRWRIQPEAVEPLVREGVARALQYGVQLERDVEFFVDCMLIFHPNFDDDDRTPWAGETLRNEELDGTQKMDRIHDHWVFDSGNRGVTTGEETQSN